MELSIYELKDKDYPETKEWVIAYNEDQAKEILKNENGLHYVDLEVIEVSKLSEQELETMYLVDINDFDPDSEDEERYFGGYKIESTFKEELDKSKGPYYLCSNNE